MAADYWYQNMDERQKLFWYAARHPRLARALGNRLRARFFYLASAMLGVLGWVLYLLEGWDSGGGGFVGWVGLTFSLYFLNTGVFLEVLRIRYDSKGGHWTPEHRTSGTELEGDNRG